MSLRFRIAELLLTQRLPALVVIAVLTCGLGYQAAQLRWSPSLDLLAPRSDPYLEVYHRYAATFGGARTLTIMIEVDEGTIFTPPTLNLVWEVTRRLGRVTGVDPSRIESIAHRSARHLQVAAGGTVRSRPLMTGPVETAEEAAAVGDIVHTAEHLRGALVSLDDQATLIRATFTGDRLDLGRLAAELQRTVLAPAGDGKASIHLAGPIGLSLSLHAAVPRLLGLVVAGILPLGLFLALYFRDWRAALRPAISGSIAAIWGFGCMQLLGVGLDPLALVVPLFLTVRAVTHAVHLHQAYTEAWARSRDRQVALVDSLAARLPASLTAVAIDALGIAVVAALPVILLPQLAAIAAFWVVAVGVAELVLSPVLFSFLGPPRVDPGPRREPLFRQEWLARQVERLAAALASRRGGWVAVAMALALVAASAVAWHALQGGQPAGPLSLLAPSSSYSVAQRRIVERFGGAEALVIVAEGYAQGAMKEPATLRAMERLQRQLERLPEVGATTSLADIVRATSLVFHEREPKWGVIPRQAEDVDALLTIFLSGLPLDEAGQYVDPGYGSAPVTVYLAAPDTAALRRVTAETERAFLAAQLDALGIAAVERNGAVEVAAVRSSRRWERDGAVWVAAARGAASGPFRPGDRILGVSGHAVRSLAGLGQALAAAAATSPALRFELQGNGAAREEVVRAPWTVIFKLMAGPLGRLAAANARAVPVALQTSTLILVTILVVAASACGSIAIGACLLVPLLLANAVAWAWLVAAQAGISLYTVPVLLVGAGLGINGAVYLVSSIREAIRQRGLDVVAHGAQRTSAGSVVASTVAVILLALPWTATEIRFVAAMAVLLIVWVAVGSLLTLTLLPAAIRAIAGGGGFHARPQRRRPASRLQAT